MLEIFIYQNGEILDRYAGGDVLEEYEMEPETLTTLQSSNVWG